MSAIAPFIAVPAGLAEAPAAPTTTLPSVVAAEDFLRGRPGGLMSVVSSTAGRAGIIFTGLYLAGERKRLLRYALAGALAIELFVLLRIKAQLASEEGQ